MIEIQCRERVRQNMPTWACWGLLLKQAGGECDEQTTE